MKGCSALASQPPFGWSNDARNWIGDFCCISTVYTPSFLRGRLGRNGSIFSLPNGWLFARQPFAPAPAFWRDEFSTPQAAFLFSRDGLPRFHPLMVRECPPISHHFNFQMRFLDETIPANFIALLAKNKATHFLIANHLAEELGRLFATGIERTANQALLVQLRRVHAAIEFHFRSVVKDQRVRVQHFHLAGDPFETMDTVPDYCGLAVRLRGLYLIGALRVRCRRLCIGAKTALKEKRRCREPDQKDASLFFRMHDEDWT